MQGGLALAREVYSPHLNMHQRLTILEALSTAARQLSQGLPAPASARQDALMQPEADAAGRSQALGGAQPGEAARGAAEQPPQQVRPCGRPMARKSMWTLQRP